MNRRIMCLSVVIMFSMWPTTMIAKEGGKVTLPLALAPAQVLNLPHQIDNWAQESVNNTLDRPFDPVVVKASPTLGGLLGKPVDQLFAYRWNGATRSWSQIPSQVDEMININLNSNCELIDCTPVYELTYDFERTETNGLDADDEFVFMAKDAGDKVRSFEWVTGTDPVRYEIEIRDPQTQESGWVYLYTSFVLSTVSDDYVSYTAGAVPSEFNTDFYKAHFSGRWSFDGLSVKPTGGGDSVDLIDKFKVRAFRIVGGETEVGYDNTSSYMGDIDGPVRAIREVKGAASGRLTTYVIKSYEKYLQQITNLRVHAIANIWTYWDYNPAAAPMTFYNPAHAGGVSMDGIRDTVDSTLYPWVQVSSSHGSLFHYYSEPIPVPAQWKAFYYKDVKAYNDRTGDRKAYGNHGINWQNLSDTNFNASQGVIATYILPANQPNVGSRFAADEENPLVVTSLLINQ